MNYGPLPPTIREVLSLRMPRQTWLSPNGRLVAYVEVCTDWEGNRNRQRLLIIDSSHGGVIRALEDADGICSSVKWALDSSFLSFISSADGEWALCRMDVGSGCVEKIACAARRFIDFDWSPDSRRVAIAQEEELPDEAANEFFHIHTESTPPCLLLVIDRETGVTKHYGPLGQVYRVSGLSWSPAGDRLLFQAVPDPDNRDQRQYLFTLDVKDGTFQQLIGDNRCIYSSVWADEGDQIAFLERKQAWHDLGGAALTALRLSDSSERVLVPHVEIRCRVLNWNSKRILLSGQALDRSHDIYSVSTDSGECVKAALGDSPLKTGPSASQTGRAISYIAYEENRFPEVTLESDITPQPIRLTDYHSQVQVWPKLTKHNVTWRSTDGQSMEGILVDARGNSSTGKHPLIVLIHGGPALTNAYNVFFDPCFEFTDPYPIRQWCEQGISVFMPDYRGSSGYGRPFKEAIVNRLGELESEDILTGIDHVLPEFGFDPGKIGVAGVSYGGYLTLLLATRHSSRFAAASACAGFVDARLQLYCSAANLESYCPENAWDPAKPLGFLSPLSFISSECPPILLQTGDIDQTVAPAHSLAFYKALKKQNGEVKLVFYKNCGHWIDYPQQLLSAQQHNFEWFAGRL